MATPVKKITPSLLKKMIIEEANKIRETLETGASHPTKVKAEEVDADEYSDTLESHIDYIKALKIHEQKLLRKLKQIREAKEKLSRKYINSI
jgi:hypothetical protein